MRTTAMRTRCFFMTHPFSTKQLTANDPPFVVLQGVCTHSTVQVARRLTRRPTASTTFCANHHYTRSQSAFLVQPPQGSAGDVRWHAAPCEGSDLGRFDG